MLGHEDYFMLYHGSYCEVQRPELARCARYKDFGQGFYLTTSQEQAKKFSLISLRKAIANGIVDRKQEYGVVSIFRCNAIELQKLKVCKFKTADRDWLNCVVAHRKGKSFSSIIDQYSEYDVIVGKIANDATNATITAYMAGVYGPVGSERAIDFCIGMLLPERLKDQCCFRTNRALTCLECMGSLKIWK